MKIKLRPGAKKNGSKSPTTATRKALAAKGQALPDNSFPVPNTDFLKRAVRSLGRTPPEKRPTVVAFLRKRARALGATNMLTKGALAMSHEEYATLLELAGDLASTDAFIPGKKSSMKKVKGGIPESQKSSGAEKSPAISAAKAKLGLKSDKGVALYAKLRKKGFPHSMAKKAAAKVEQGLNVSEMSNSPKA